MYEWQYDDDTVICAYSTQDFALYDIPEYPIVKGNRNIYYYNVACSFDIETSTVELQGRPTGFMYHWQFCLNDYVVFGRYWEEFTLLLEYLKDKLHLNENRRLVIYSHFLEFEFQHMRNFIDVESIFARDDREVMYVRFNQAFESRCSYKLSNMSLGKFIENTPNAKFSKQSGKDFNYRKLRLPTTKLSDLELTYCYCDVRGLCEALNHLLEEDSIATLPLTSTGFVRRDVRKSVKSNPDNRQAMLNSRLTPRQYVLCKTAARGGNSHANAYYTDEIIYDMHAKDIASSYPAAMIVCLFPMEAFQMASPKISTVENYKDYAQLIDCTFHNVRIKNPMTIPYISFAKCTNVRNAIKDNGRIVTCDQCSMVITDVDFRIITETYDILGGIEIREIYVSKYGHLNNEFRLNLLDKFTQKCKLKGVDGYLYNKFKNKINAFFGMMLTDICSPEIYYDPTLPYPWKSGDIDIGAMLDKYYNSKSSFLSYQHGIWVTAHARDRLQESINIVGQDTVYVDTDSNKYVGEHEADFRSLNEQWRKRLEANDICPIVTVNGKEFVLGAWENDGHYSQFKTLGSKKYAFIKEGEKNVNITVAGLNKESGADFIAKHGGLDSFEIGTVVPEAESGRTSAYYNDVPEPYQLTIQGVTFTTASNVGVVECSYTFGVSDDYYEYFINCDESRINFKERMDNEKYNEEDEYMDKQGHI